MTTIVTRSGKGSPLTHIEADANFTNLNNDKLETSTVGVTVQAYSANLDEYAAVNPTTAGLALLDDADAAAQRTTLGLVIGTDVQAYDGDLQTIAALTPSNDDILQRKSGAWTNRTLAQLVADLSALIAIPTGAVQYFAMNSAPTGWLAADGSAVSRTTYADLYTAIGTSYGVGDGSTTFNLPDLRGYFLRGSGTNGDGTAAGTFGAKQADDILAHTHTLGPWQHTIGAGTSDTGPMWGGGGSYFSSQSSATASSGGSETRPKNIPLLACIKI